MPRVDLQRLEIGIEPGIPQVRRRHAGRGLRRAFHADDEGNQHGESRDDNAAQT